MKFFDRLKNLFKRKKKDSVEEFEDKYYDDTGEYEVDINEINADYEEDEEDEEEFVAREMNMGDVEKSEADNIPDLPSLPPTPGEKPAPKFDTLPNENFEDDDDDHVDTTRPDFNEFNINSKENKIKEIWGQLRNRFNDIFRGGKQSRSSKFSLSADGGKKILNAIRDFDYDHIFKKVFSPESRNIIHRGFLVVFIASSSYLTGRMIANILKPSVKERKKVVAAAAGFSFRPNYREEINDIMVANLFNAEGIPERPTLQDSKPQDMGPKICESATRASSLPYKLMNTIVLQDSVKSIAAVSVRGGKDVQHIREGDKLSDIEVGRITRLKMIFKNKKTMQCEYIANVDESAKRTWERRKPKITKDTKILKKDPGISNVGNNFKIKKSVRDSVLGNITEELTKARAIQMKNPDGSMCFKMVEVVPGSIYSKLNIQNDDVICNINGKKIMNMNDLFALFGRIRDIDHFEMTVNRDGQELPMTYDFE